MNAFAVGCVVVGFLILVGGLLVWSWLSATANELVRAATEETLPYVHTPSPPETDNADSDDGRV